MADQAARQAERSKDALTIGKHRLRLGLCPRCGVQPADFRPSKERYNRKPRRICICGVYCKCYDDCLAEYLESDAKSVGHYCPWGITI